MQSCLANTFADSAAGAIGLCADHWLSHLLLWGHCHHRCPVQVLGAAPQLWAQHLLHHIHLGPCAYLHLGLCLPLESGDCWAIDIWSGVPVLCLAGLVCNGQ